MKYLAMATLLGLFGLSTACTPKKNLAANSHVHHGTQNVPAGTEPELVDVDPTSLTYYRDIKPILAASCEGCHSTGGLAPFALTELKQVKIYAESIRHAIVDRVMPPWLADQGHQLYRDDISLEDQEIAKILAWIDNGFSEGNKADYLAEVKAPPVFDVQLPILPQGQAYMPDQEWTDEYRCFIVPVPESLADTPWITGFSTIPGNPKLVHHLVAHTVDEDVLWAIKKMDDDEDGLGYRCAGGALPDAISGYDVQEGLEAIEPGIVNKLMTGTHWLAHWAPGMDEGTMLPDGLGLKLPVGGALILQMHYYVGSAYGEVDKDSKIAFKLAKEVKKPAFYYPFTNLEWLLGIFNNSMVVEPNSEGAFSVEARYDEVAEFGRQNLSLGATPIKALEAHSANLHMHAIGKSGIMTVQKEGEAPETLLSISHWNLHWQRDYQFVQPKIIPTQDLAKYTRKLTCVYQNNSKVPVYGGPASENEMCYDFALFAFDLGEGKIEFARKDEYAGFDPYL